MTLEPTTRLGALIDTWLGLVGRSLTDVADGTDLSIWTISRLRRGRTRATREHLSILADWFSAVLVWPRGDVLLALEQAARADGPQ